MADISLTKLTEHLFSSLEELDGTDIDGKPMSEEATMNALRRAETKVNLSDAVLRIASTRIDMAKAIAAHGSPAATLIQPLLRKGQKEEIDEKE